MMEIILIILTSTIIAASFFAVYEYGRNKGYDAAKKEYEKDQAIEVNRLNQKFIKGVDDFANFNG